MTEQPLVTWQEIAKHLRVSKRVAKIALYDARVPIIHIGRRVAVYPSTLKLFLEGSQQHENE